MIFDEVDPVKMHSSSIHKAFWVLPVFTNVTVAMVHAVPEFPSLPGLERKEQEEEEEDGGALL